MFVAERPLFHLQRRSKLFSKFQGPFLSTQSNWNPELNLNWKRFFPTSTILRSEPIFQAALRVFFKARWFCCLSVRSLPNTLRAHSSIRSDLFMVEIWMSSSSSFVRRRCCRSSITDMSILQGVESKREVGRAGVWGWRERETLIKREGGLGKPRERAPMERESSY